MKHTPGPWHWFSSSIIGTAENGQPHHITKCEAINSADARLIATCPELFAIVEYLKLHLDEGAQQVSFHALATDDDETTLGDLVKQAYAKATGGAK